MLITVTGLPRSGTAFLSMLFQLHPECQAYHELAAYDKDWRTTIMENDADYVADCNTYAMFTAYDLEPDRKIYVVNSAEESFKASEKALRRKLDRRLFDEIEAAGATWAVFDECYVILREDVFTELGCCNIWKYCFEDCEPPVTKIRELIKLNVQHHNAHEVFAEEKKFVL